MLFPGLAWLRTRYEVVISTGILAREGYFAGGDARRAAELRRALSDPEAAAVLVARGGYGAMRVVDAVAWDAFVARPKWIVGFSDVTALHVEANARGICTIHGPNVTGLGRGITAAERASLLDALERPGAPCRFRGLEVLREGRAEGPVVGGNLALVAAMAGGGRLVVPEGAILVLEDVTERPYRVDRMLTSLRLGGHVARASAVVFGGFTDCEPGADGVTVSDVLAELARTVDAPVVAGAPFGHGAPNHAFVLGRAARLVGDELAFLPD